MLDKAASRAGFDAASGTAVAVAARTRLRHRPGPGKNDGDLPQLSFPFPYGEPWPIQRDFMTALYRCIDNKAVGIFESPTGTGKSLSLICGSVKWLYDRLNLPPEAQLQDLIREKLFDAGLLDPPAAAAAVADDDNEPDWVKDHARRTVEREAKIELDARLAQRKRMQERLAAARADRRRRARGNAPPQKRRAIDDGLDSRTTDGNDDEYLVAYESDGEDSSTGSRNAPRDWLKIALEDQRSEAAAPADNAETYEEPKIFYCSRTHSQLSQFVNEVKKTEHSEWLKVVSLGSRKNLCINSDVTKLKTLSKMND
ncbi:DEAD H (Asp-Glu-Ala-Asp His) box helicase 11, partial [Cladochytrium tenue]